MEPRRSQIILKQFKELSQRIEPLVDIPLKTIQRAMIAWPIVWQCWSPDKVNYQEYHSVNGGNGLTAEAVDYLWLWDTVQFSQTKALAYMGGSFGTIIDKMASAFCIYPDGTYSHGFYFLLKQNLGKE
jgi:hypothetical protein